MALLALRVFAFVVGLAALVYFFLSVIRSSLLVRHRQDRLAGMVIRVVHGLFRLGLSRTQGYEARDRVLVYEAPAIVIVLIGTWFLFVTLAFTPIFWAIDTGSLLHAFVTSGMSLSTLGSVVATTDLGQVTSVAEGAVGLGIVALLITFMPEFYTVVAQREGMVSWLARRVGATPPGVAIVEWLHRTGQLRQQADIWSTWENWYESLQETHSSLTIMIYFRSFTSGQSWVTTAGAIADAVALVASTVDVPRDPCVDIVLKVSAGALSRIVAAAYIPRTASSPDDEASGVTRAAYETACGQLAAAGVPLKPDRDECWRDFAALRARYGPALQALVKEVEAPPVPWPSG